MWWKGINRFPKFPRIYESDSGIMVTLKVIWAFIIFNLMIFVPVNIVGGFSGLTLLESYVMFYILLFCAIMLFAVVIGLIRLLFAVFIGLIRLLIALIAWLINFLFR